MRIFLLTFGLVLGSSLISFAAPVATSTSTARSDDNWLDASEFLDKAYGFVPIAAPITEPAVGYGGAGGLLFIDRPKAADDRPGFGRPNLTAVGGLGTENGTAGGFGIDSRHWMDDRLQTLTGAMYATINLDFYGTGEDSRLRNNPLHYTIQPAGGMLNTNYRLGNTPFKAGVGYAYASTNVRIDTLSSDPRRPMENRVSHVGSANLSALYDDRDNLFTPRSGGYYELSANVCSQALGGDDEFQRAGPTLIHYMRLSRDWSFGILGSGTFAFGDTPFYMLPYVSLRGVPAMRYQGKDAAQTEAELSWQFWKRFSLVAFGGAGAAWNGFTKGDNEANVVSGGGGFRYELARKYGLHMGLDIATSHDGPAIYVQVGSAWMRP